LHADYGQAMMLSQGFAAEETKDAFTKPTLEVAALHGLG
jgi:hypothetical protein